jgi:hypothetical protein
MTKHLLMKIALGAAALFALGVAAPALACGKDCDCAKKAEKAEKKDTTKPAEKPAADKKADLSAPGTSLLAADEAKCKCEKGGKGCTCKKGECKCENCGQKKFTEAEKCKCKDGAKECGCEKGKCHCQPSKKDEKKAA